MPEAQLVWQWLPVLGVFAGILVGALIALWSSRLTQRRGGRRHQRHGLRSEREAERLLTKAGYTIEARQPVATWTMQIDGEDVEVRCRGDLLVRRRGRRYIAEVKAGRHGANSAIAGTRRQLLEYALAFSVDGVLLVDMRERRVHQIAFPWNDT